MSPEHTLEELFIKCCSKGYIDSIILLISLGVDPGTQSNQGIIYASESGYIDIVQLLLQDPRVETVM